MAYKVKLDVFEGPFDLLVYLIESAEMNIYDIQIAEITAQYLAYVEELKRMDPALSGEFMLLAATLIEIKAKMLLPRLRPDGPEEAAEDPRTELVQRILEYKKYKGAAEQLGEREERNARIFEKPAEDRTPYTHQADYYLNLDIQGFVRAFEAFLSKKRRIEEVHKRYESGRRNLMSLETRIEQLKQLFARKKEFSFPELLEGNDSRYQQVLTFLSVLQLMRERAIEVKQRVAFGEIRLKVVENEQKGTAQ